MVVSLKLLHALDSAVEDLKKQSSQSRYKERGWGEESRMMAYIIMSHQKGMVFLGEEMPSAKF